MIREEEELRLDKQVSEFENSSIESRGVVVSCLLSHCDNM